MLAAYLEHFAGRRTAKDLDSPEAAQAELLMAAGRRALAAPNLTKRARARALRIFRAAQQTARPNLLRLVLDSWSQLAPALRREGAARTRFLRFESWETVLEVQLRGSELRGQITPALAGKATFETGGRSRSSKIGPDGTFHVRRLRKGKTTITVGDVRAEFDV